MFEVKCGNIFVTEHGEFSFLCSNCNLVYCEFNEYRNHVLDAHLTEYFNEEPDSKNDFKLGILKVCEIDEDTFNINSSNRFEKEGVSEILTIEELNEEDLKEEVSDCEEKYEFEDENSNFENSEESSELKVEITNDEEEYSEPISCRVCNKHYNDVESFNKHKKKCNVTFCPICSLELHDDISKHILNCRSKKPKRSKSDAKSINQQKSVCKYCDRVFYVESAFQKHMFVHETNSDKCDLCGKRFRTLDSLRNHIRRHKGERPFKCSVCSSAFNDKINLKTHYIVKHTEGLKIPCEYKGCGRIFKTVELRKRHQRYVHNSDSNYLCLSCGMKFKTSSKLNEHTKKKHLDYKDRPHECEYCKKKFIFLQDLKNHKMTHTGEKPFKCEMCPKGFIKKYELTKHIRKKHSNSTNNPEDML